MLVESPRATGAAGRPPPALLTTRAAHARRARQRRVAVVPAVPIALRNGALASAVVLTATGRGDLWTLAIAFGVADASLATALVVLGAGVATLARSGSAGLGDIAGAQAVLGAAGFTGSVAAVGATWASALSLVVVARHRWASAGLGLLAGALVAGPSLSGGAKSVVVCLLGAGVGAVVGWFAAPRPNQRRWQSMVALGIGAAGVAFGLVAGYH